ncbi:restriction modification system DNA specificity domain-containing protein [Lacticaseibacillus paracasei subsp. paracasei Lpp219]|nr:restriction modification system DNA specificity domain-containing protein [Lacticaseibacillus paracasei subsp. paracasei Lpp219]
MAEFDCLYSEVLLTRNAWEKRKLGEIAGIFDGTHQTPNYQSSGIMFLSVENIQTLKSNKFISLEDFQKDFKVSPRTGDILMTRIGNIGTTNVVKSTRPIAYYVSLALIRPNDAIDVYYLNYAINGLSFQRELRRRTLSVAFPQKINKQEIGKSIVDLPSPSEQIQIGNLFVLLDNLIAATQHKIDALEQAKKALLQRLFDQSWRFKGYSDPWEKRKLGELMKVTSVKRVHQSDWRQEGVPFLRARDIVAINKNQKVKEPIYISRDLYERYSEQSGRVTPGDLLVTGVGSIGIPFLIKTESPIYFKDGNIIWFQNRTLDPAFFYFQFTGNSIQTYILSTSGKGTVGTFTIATGKQTPIVFPKKTEQKLIGSTMSDLDNLIAATQSRLSSLELLKKALLQDLFI